MKRVLPFLILAFVLCQCGSKAPQDKTNNKSPRDQYPEKFTENYIGERAKMLIEFVPDHAFDPSIKPAFTKAYFDLLDEAWMVPVNSFEGIGPEEFLYYFMTGNGDCECSSHPKTIHDIKVLDDDSAWVKMNYIHQDHEMVLHFEDGDWVIADFDGTKDQLADYIHEQRDVLMKLDLDSLHGVMLKELVGDYYSKKDVEAQFDEYKSSVEAYFKKYPK